MSDVANDELQALHTRLHAAVIGRALDFVATLTTLEHHQDREDQIFYPQAAAELDRAARSRIVAALAASAR